MGLYKYFPKGEKKVKTTVLTAALLLSGIPAEVINRSMETYSKMGEVFTDLCVYFFTFIFCHELLDYWGSEVPWNSKNSAEFYKWKQFPFNIALTVSKGDKLVYTFMKFFFFTEDQLISFPGLKGLSLYQCRYE